MLTVLPGCHSVVSSVSFSKYKNMTILVFIALIICTIPNLLITHINSLAKLSMRISTVFTFCKCKCLLIEYKLNIKKPMETNIIFSSPVPGYMFCLVCKGFPFQKVLLCKDFMGVIFNVYFLFSSRVFLHVLLNSLYLEEFCKYIDITIQIYIFEYITNIYSKTSFTILLTTIGHHFSYISLISYFFAIVFDHVNVTCQKTKGW